VTNRLKDKIKRQQNSLWFQ